MQLPLTFTHTMLKNGRIYSVLRYSNTYFYCLYMGHTKVYHNLQQVELRRSIEQDFKTAASLFMLTHIQQRGTMVLWRRQGYALSTPKYHVLKVITQNVCDSDTVAFNNNLELDNFVATRSGHVCIPYIISISMF